MFLDSYKFQPVEYSMKKKEKSTFRVVKLLGMFSKVNGKQTAFWEAASILVSLTVVISLFSNGKALKDQKYP